MILVALRRLATALTAALGVGVLGAGCDAGYSVDASANDAAPPDGAGTSDGGTTGTVDGAGNPGVDGSMVHVPIALDLGTGMDGAFTGMSVANSPCFGHVTGAAGGTTLATNGKFDNTTTPPGTVLFVHQTQGTGAGNYELVSIQSVSNQKNVATLSKPLVHSFSDPGAQAVVMRQYTDVTVAAGQAVSAPAWDGQCGGILPFRATGTASVLGAIDLSARGFRGHAHTCTLGFPPYQCDSMTPDTGAANGFAGESELGVGLQLATAHGSGGGGALDGSDCGMGGGGSHGTTGVAGPNGGGLPPCRSGGMLKQFGGAAGLVTVGADLSPSILFGGAGGEGGADEDGALPGPGGNSGGIVFIVAKSIIVTGTISAAGAPGGVGVAVSMCGGTGTGMGGGGGGAGGSIRLAAYSVDVGTNKVVAAGGGGGACGGQPGILGGAGGAGRIGVLSDSTKGSTTPAFDAR